MSTMTKVFVVLTSVVAIVLSCLTVATAARWTNQQETIESYRSLSEADLIHRMNVEVIMATKLAMKDDELQQQAQELTNAQGRVRDLEAQLEGLRIDLARQTNEKVNSEAGRKKIEEILEVTTAELTSTQKQNQVLLTQNIDLQTRNQRLASRNLELTSQLTISTDENRNLQEKLYAAEQQNKELQQVLASGRRVAPAAEAPSGALPAVPPVAGPIAGEVVQVDGGYVSVNIGETSGVLSGMTFMVYRGEQYVGDLKIDNVRPKEAGGKLTMVRQGEQVQPGDRVAYGLE